jgi:hypothetical protein
MSSDGFGQIGSKTKKGFQDPYKAFLPFRQALKKYNTASFIKYLKLWHDMQMWAVLVVEKVEVVVLFQEPNFWEISVKGKAFDGTGRFFDVEAVFPVHSDADGDRTINDMNPGAIYMIKGRYDFGQSNSIIRIFDAWYKTTKFNSKIVREAYEAQGR